MANFGGVFTNVQKVKAKHVKHKAQKSNNRPLLGFFRKTQSPKELDGPHSPPHSTILQLLCLYFYIFIFITRDVLFNSIQLELVSVSFSLLETC